MINLANTALGGRSFCVGYSQSNKKCGCFYDRPRRKCELADGQRSAFTSTDLKCFCRKRVIFGWRRTTEFAESKCVRYPTVGHCIGGKCLVKQSLSRRDFFSGKNFSVPDSKEHPEYFSSLFGEIFIKIIFREMGKTCLYKKTNCFRTCNPLARAKAAVPSRRKSPPNGRMPTLLTPTNLDASSFQIAKSCGIVKGYRSLRKKSIAISAFDNRSLTLSAAARFDIVAMISNVFSFAKPPILAELSIFFFCSKIFSDFALVRFGLKHYSFQVVF